MTINKRNIFKIKLCEENTNIRVFLINTKIPLILVADYNK